MTTVLGDGNPAGLVAVVTPEPHTGYLVDEAGHPDKQVGRHTCAA